MKNSKCGINQDFLHIKKQKQWDVLKQSNDKLLEDSFYKDLEFGTGGLRGIIGLGTNRVNRFTIRRATQGIANYLNAIDSKHLKKQSLLMTQGIFSKEFALETALVCSKRYQSLSI